MLKVVFQSILSHSLNRVGVTSSILQKHRHVFAEFTLARMSSSVKIGTHDGTFHCDEALACFLLKVLPRYKDATIVRSRDLSILDTCDIVVDVGGKYDPSKHRYDHHMREFNETSSSVTKNPDFPANIKLSSAGLVYCHFGQEILREILRKDMSNEDVEDIFKNVYNTLIKEIDAIDNGVLMCSDEPLYRITTDLSSRVQRLNPDWNSQDTDTNGPFLKAVQLTGEEFMHFVHSAATSWLPARSIVQEAVAKRFEIDPSGEIMELSTFAPWNNNLCILEKQLNISPPVKYVIFRSETYRVRAVPVTSGSFASRMPLPDTWGGLRDEALVETCGIPGAIFVHSGLFIGGHMTREGAIEMARKALEMGKAAAKDQ